MSDDASLVPGAAHARYLCDEARRLVQMSREELRAEQRAYLERHGLHEYLQAEAAPVETAPVEAAPVEAAPPTARVRARGPGVTRAAVEAQLPLFARTP